MTGELEPLTKEKLYFAKRHRKVASEEDIRLAYLWAIEKITSSMEDFEKELKKNKNDRYSIGQVTTHAWVLDILKKAFEAVSA